LYLILPSLIQHKYVQYKNCKFKINKDKSEIKCYEDGNLKTTIVVEDAFVKSVIDNILNGICAKLPEDIKKIILSNVLLQHRNKVKRVLYPSDEDLTFLAESLSGSDDIDSKMLKIIFETGELVPIPNPELLYFNE
jgi:predicted DNA binding protein